METKTLFDFGASTCFIDKELVQQHKMIFVKKNTLVGHWWSKSFFRTCDAWNQGFRYYYQDAYKQGGL